MAEMKIALSEKLYVKDNNFTFLRFIAASMVLLYHSYALLGFKAPLRNSLGSLAVSIFIVISGFLVTKSWLDEPHFAIFLKKRFLRVFPALFCSVAVAVFLVGPLVTYVNMHEYFSDPLTFSYMENIFLFPIHYQLPGVFENNPLPLAVNGSLWTLPIEVFLYLSVIILGLLGTYKKRYTFTALLVGLLFLERYFRTSLVSQHTFMLTMPAAELLQLSIYFFIGTLYCIYHTKIILDYRVALLMALLFFLSYVLPYGDLLSYLSLPYIVLYLAYSDIPFIKGFQRWSDLSYGTYVYAFLVQQTVIYFLGARINVMVLFSLSYFVTLIVSYLSWNLVEKQCLKLKKWKVRAVWSSPPLAKS
jgi:peptidoglycan/LPS O-acetylase OafA/YrhL